MTALGLDTSVAVPLLVRTHRAHAAVVRWWDGREVALSGHALAETYSVLTRLPGDLRLAPGDAARLLGERFPEPLLLRSEVAGAPPGHARSAGDRRRRGLRRARGARGRRARRGLATRDARAKATYETIGVRVIVAG